MTNKCKMCGQPLVRERTVCDKHVDKEDWKLVKLRISGKELPCDSVPVVEKGQPGQQ